MNMNNGYPTTFISLARSLWKNGQLIVQMTKREVMSRYKGSVLGLFWSFFNPILMLTIYTFVFSVIFNSRWGDIAGTSKGQFAIVLFVGLIVQALFAEVINRSPSLIISNANYVKKVIFPLEVLPIVSIGAALFHCFISIGVLLAAFVLFNGYIHWTAIFMPLVLLPFVILTMGFSWFLVSMGVFLRDIGQTTSLITMLMLYLSPVFYPITAVPMKLQPYMMANPLTFIIEQSREVLIQGNMPNWLGLGFYTIIACFVAWLGYAWFQQCRKMFADFI